VLRPTSRPCRAPCGSACRLRRLGPSGHGAPDSGAGQRADDHVAGEMNAGMNPGVSHGRGENQQGRSGTGQAAAHAGGECEPGSGVPGRERPRGRHCYQPGGRNVRAHAVWTLSRMHGFDPDVDGRRGDTHRGNSPHSRSPSGRPAEDRDSGSDREPDAGEISGLRNPSRWFVQPRDRGRGDRRVERLIGGAGPTSAGGEQASPWPGAGRRPAGQHNLRGLDAGLTSTHHRMLAAARAGARGPDAATGTGHE
jgi:hypothetical protein